MNDEELKSIIDQFLESGDMNDKWALLFFAQEIERRTRHKAVSMAHDLADKINNMRNQNND